MCWKPAFSSSCPSPAGVQHSLPCPPAMPFTSTALLMLRGILAAPLLRRIPHQAVILRPHPFAAAGGRLQWVHVPVTKVLGRGAGAQAKQKPKLWVRDLAWIWLGGGYILKKCLPSAQLRHSAIGMCSAATSAPSVRVLTSTGRKHWNSDSGGKCICPSPAKARGSAPKITAPRATWSIEPKGLSKEIWK